MKKKRLHLTTLLCLLAAGVLFTTGCKNTVSYTETTDSNGETTVICTVYASDLKRLTSDDLAQKEFGNTYTISLLGKWKNEELGWLGKTLHDISGRHITLDMTQIEGNTSIETYAFMYCSSLEKVIMGNNITSIDDSGFYGCSSLKSINIPDSVKSIGRSAFDRCSSLTSIIIPEGITTIRESAFDMCTSLTSVTIPDSVKSIGRGAFNLCTSLTSITIPDSITSIDEQAFDQCYSLKTVYAGSIENWLSISFDNPIGYNANPCSNGAALYLKGKLATNIVIPDGTTNIGRNAFAGCTSITGITIPDSVTVIGERAFYDCRSLASITIEGVTRIDECAFYSCESLKSITLGDNVTLVGFSIFDGCSDYTLTVGANFVSKDYGESYDGGYVFRSSLASLFKGYKAVIIKDGVTRIGNCVFFGSGEFLLESVTIPETVTDIGDYAFDCCGSLKSINIPNSVTTIGKGAFRGCGFTNVTIPNRVTVIDDHTFWGCPLTSIEIPNGVIKIGDAAFAECTSLESITIPETVTKIGNFVFQSTALTTVIFTGTVAQWYMIEKSGWKNNGLTGKVICSNGEVELGQWE